MKQQLLIINRSRQRAPNLTAIDRVLLGFRHAESAIPRCSLPGRVKPYIDAKGSCNAFDSLWQRFMDKVLAETDVTDRFQERDLRAKVASSDSDSLIEASERVGGEFVIIA